MSGVAYKDCTVLVMVGFGLSQRKGFVDGPANDESRVRTLTIISGLRGLRSKSLKRASSPISGSASGKCVLNHSRVRSRLSSRSNSVVGAKRVQVKVLSYRTARQGSLNNGHGRRSGSLEVRYLTLLGSAMSMKEWRGQMCR